MPLLPVTCARVGSNEVVIDCDTVPGAATGTDEVMVNEPPPFADVVPTFEEAVTDLATALAGDPTATTPMSEKQSANRAEREMRCILNIL